MKRNVSMMVAAALLAVGLFTGCATTGHDHGKNCQSCCKDNCGACCKDAAACAKCCGPK